MDSHLVTVKVGVKSSTDQWVQLDRLAFDKNRLKSLDAETVQGRCTVEHDRVFLDNLFKDVPDLGALALDQLLGTLDRGAKATFFELVVDKGFEQLQRHLLRKTALVQP